MPRKRTERAAETVLTHAMAPTPAPNRRNRMTPRFTVDRLQGTALITMLIGVWLVVSALVFQANADLRGHHIFWGVVAVAAGGLQFYQEAQGQPPVYPVSLALLGIGIWVLITPFVLGAMIPTLISSLIAGGVLVTIGTWELRQSKRLTARRYA